MSKYTVQLRWLVEQYLENYNIKSPIANPPLIAQHNWRFIYGDLGLSDGTIPNTAFQLSAYPIFDEDHRRVLNDMIIKRYWNCEIGAETPAMFAWNLNEAMCRIMPYYNGLYRAQMASIVDMITEKWGETDIEGIVRKVLNEVNGKTDTLSDTEGGYNIDTTGKVVEDTDTTGSTTGSQNTTNDHSIDVTGETTDNGTRNLTVNQTVTGSSTDRFLDTPQASVSNLDDGWLTNVRKVESNETTERTENETNQNTQNRTEKTTDIATIETTTSDTSEGTVDKTTDTTGNEKGTSTSKTTGNVSTENSSTTDDTTNRDRKADGWRISPKDWEMVLTAARELFNIDRMVVEDEAVRECFMMVW